METKRKTSWTGLLSEAITLCATMLVVGYGFAQTWTKSTSMPGNTIWPGVACSADGKVILAVGSAATPLFSTNSGVTWAPMAAAPVGYGRVASSADGKKFLLEAYAALSDPSVYLSVDSGNTWNQTLTATGYWNAVASSADGTKLFATFENYSGAIWLWLSTNSGSSWQTSSAPTIVWSSLATSTDGTKLIGSGSGQIYTSTNSGNNWQLATVGGIAVACSADGRTLVAAGTNGTCVSTNFGRNWRTNSVSVGYDIISGNNVASSADGKRLVLAGRGSPIYTSTNSGTTWVTNNAPSSWEAVASSADGCTLVAIDYVNGIWIGRLTNSPKLNLGKTNGSIAFSWPVASPNFVLQQNPDLGTTNWTTLTNTPTLIFTNLQDQITFPATNSSGFFRLSTQ